jgi:hypothetical protein
MGYNVEFKTPAELADNASDVVYKALVSVLRIVRDGATFLGYFKGSDQPIMWIEASGKESDLK